jgi:hypothetical protein
MEGLIGGMLRFCSMVDETEIIMKQHIMCNKIMQKMGFLWREIWTVPVRQTGLNERTNAGSVTSRVSSVFIRFYSNKIRTNSFIEIKTMVVQKQLNT